MRKGHRQGRSRGAREANDQRAQRWREQSGKGRTTSRSAVAKAEPATLGEVAVAVKRGAPAISRAIDALVRDGQVERQADPDNRRRLALRLTDSGREALARPPVVEGGLSARLAKLSTSELRALERGIEILERLPR